MSHAGTNIAVYGGAFDPVHLGHEAIIKYLMRRFAFDRLHVIPYAQSGFHKHPVAPGAARMAMLNLVCKHAKHCHADARELQRPGCSYAIDTVLSISAEHPSANIFLVLSTESLASFTLWRQWQDIIKLARILCLSRANHPASLNPALADNMAAGSLDLDCLNDKRIFMDNFEPPSISSSMIRHGLRKDTDVASSLNPHVHHYIKHHGLYRE